MTTGYVPEETRPKSISPEPARTIPIGRILLIALAILVIVAVVVAVAGVEVGTLAALPDKWMW